MSSSRSASKSATKKRPVKKATAKKPAAKKVTKKVITKVKAPNPTVEMCKELAALVEIHSLSELIVDTKGMTLTLRRGGNSVMPMEASAYSPVHQMVAPMAAPTLATPAAEVPEEDDAHLVTSPFVGTFYRAPNPESSAYCEVGQRVEKGQVLCIVEAMKLMNEIEADMAGVVESILVDNADVVEYGKPLFKIKP